MDKESLIALFVHSTLLNILAQKAMRDDPHFAEEAIGELDTYLGKVAGHGGYHPLPEDWLVEARNEFTRIISGPLQLTLGMPASLGRATFITAPTTRPRTLRRRFLNWLSQGE